MSNTLDRPASSAGVSRSKSRVASPARCSALATNRFRPLPRPLPLPCANSTMPPAPAGTVSSPGRASAPAVTCTSALIAGPASRGPAARPSRLTTSASLVCEKSWYHWPMAKNGSGDSTQITWSATSPSRATVAGGATGTARITFAAPCARATWQATWAVDPVAMPSSTTIAVFPASGTRGRCAR